MPGFRLIFSLELIAKKSAPTGSASVVCGPRPCSLRCRGREFKRVPPASTMGLLTRGHTLIKHYLFAQRVELNDEAANFPRQKSRAAAQRGYHYLPQNLNNFHDLILHTYLCLAQLYTQLKAIGAH